MPQSLSNVIVHLVFSTKNRQKFLTKQLQSDLHPYLSQTLQNNGCQVLTVGGVEDHVHILFAISRTLTLAASVEAAKTSSSKLMKTKGCHDFQWQSGYGAFSIGRSEVEAVKAYVRNQEEHHRHLTFQEEYRRFLTEYGIVFDEKYAWD